MSLSFVEPNKPDRLDEPDRPNRSDPRHAPQNSECLLFSAVEPRSSPCGEFHKFVARWRDGRILTCKYIRIVHIASRLSISTEVTMRTHSQPPTTQQTIDRKMPDVLKNNGAQSLEGLSTLAGVGWSQVVMPVDRLSRIGRVSLTPVRPCEYRIWIGGLLRR